MCFLLENKRALIKIISKDNSNFVQGREICLWANMDLWLSWVTPDSAVNAVTLLGCLHPVVYNTGNGRNAEGCLRPPSGDVSKTKEGTSWGHLFLPQQELFSCSFQNPEEKNYLKRPEMQKIFPFSIDFPAALYFLIAETISSGHRTEVSQFVKLMSCVWQSDCISVGSYFLLWGGQRWCGEALAGGEGKLLALRLYGLLCSQEACPAEWPGPFHLYPGACRSLSGWGKLDSLSKLNIFRQKGPHTKSHLLFARGKV